MHIQVNRALRTFSDLIFTDVVQGSKSFAIPILEGPQQGRYQSTRKRDSRCFSLLISSWIGKFASGALQPRERSSLGSAPASGALQPRERSSVTEHLQEPLRPSLEAVLKE